MTNRTHQILIGMTLILWMIWGGQAFAEFPGSLDLGALESGNQVTITFKVTVNASTLPTVHTVSNQATVSGGNFADATTDDPDISGDSDPTLTPIEIPAPVYDFSAAAFSVPEGNATVTLQVVKIVRSQNIAIASSVDAVLSGSGAHPAMVGSDFTDGVITVNFAAGETEKVVPIEIIGDAANGFNKTVSLSLTNFTVDGEPSGQAGTTPGAVLTLANDDDPPMVSIGNAQVSEDDGSMDFTVSLSAASERDVSVDYATSDGSAASGSDYTQAGGTLVIAAGSLSELIPVDLVDDAEGETEETFTVTLSDPVNAIISQAQGTGTIIDNDNQPPTDMGLGPAHVAENAPEATVVGLFSTIDPDTGDSHTYTLIATDQYPDNTLFCITDNALKTAAVFDFETLDNYRIRVQTQDPGGERFDKTFDISIDNVIESDLAVEKTVDTPGPAVGDNVMYTVTVINHGPEGAAGVAVTDQLPAGLAYVSDDAEGDYTDADGQWRIGDLSVDGQAVLHITAQVDGTGQIINTAHVTCSGAQDPDALNDKASALIETDSDRDGLSDVLEESTCTNADDADTDDDGIADGDEDTNHNGQMDADETDPCEGDSDGDGLQDGTESGLTQNDIGPDTDLNVFVPDLDPDSTTNPLDSDSDGDGWADGEEDVNRNGRLDAGESNPDSDTSPISTPPEIRAAIPHDGAGITDDTRVPVNSSFAVRITDDDGIDVSTFSNVALSINDGVLGSYERNSDDDTIRVIKLDPVDPDVAVTDIWVVYDRSREPFGSYPTEALVDIRVEARDINDDPMVPAEFAFKVESAEAQAIARNNLSKSSPLIPDDPAYDAGLQIDNGVMAGARMYYDSQESALPIFGPTGEIPPLDIASRAVGEPLNLQPPTVFNTPVTLFIPCPGETTVCRLSVFLFEAGQWHKACTRTGAVTVAGEDWIIPGSRVNHNDSVPPTIEIQVRYSAGAQAGFTENDHDDHDHDLSGVSGCFMTTILNTFHF